MAGRRDRAEAVDEVPGVTSLQHLAVGRRSTVYRAWQPDLNRWVAVKVLGFPLSDGGARDRYLRECSAVGRLTGHPNIVTVLKAGVTRSSRPYLTMDLFEQGSLADVTRTSGPGTVELVLRYGVKLSGALETAHRAGILHCDVKPENVLVASFGEPALADFGIPALGEAHGDTETLATTSAAPEVLDGGPAAPAADVYGLGSTLWTALAGRPPFGDGSEGPLKMMLRVLREPVPPLGRPDVPPALEEALQWAMAKAPAERAPTALAFGERLQSIQVDLGLPVTELVVPSRAPSSAPGPTEPGEHAEPVAPPSTNASTMVLPRKPPPVRPPPPTPAGTTAGARSRLVPLAIVTAALLLATAMVIGAVLITRNRGGSPTRPTSVQPVPSTAAGSSSSTEPPALSRTPRAVAVRINGPGTILVTWQPPEDRSGLTGFTVAHRSKEATDPITPQPVGDPNAVAAEIPIPSPGSRCVVVQSVYTTGPGPISNPVCT